MKVSGFIDSHNHLYDGFTLEEMGTVYRSYQIRLGLVSDLTGGDLGNRPGLRTLEQTILANRRVQEAVAQTSFLKGQFFYDCRYDVADDRLFDYLMENKETFVGIKIHPPISQTAVDSPAWDGILGFARDCRIPVMLHTDASGLCNMQAVQHMVDRFPGLTAVLGHCFLDVPLEEVAAFFLKNEGVIGETSWADREKVIGLLTRISPERLMFGTDAPVDGELGRGVPLNPERSGFRWYRPLLEGLKALPDEVYNQFMVGTAQRVYGLAD